MSDICDYCKADLSDDTHRDDCPRPPRPTTEEGRADLTAIFTSADRLRAYFMERGWSIHMEDNGRSVIDPFAAIIEATALAAPPSEQEEPPHNHDGGAHCFSTCPAYTWQVRNSHGESVTMPVGSTPVPALRHHPKDGCCDPDHDRILEAWYARAEALLDRTPVPALDGLSDRGALEQACIAVVGPWFEESHERGRFTPMELAQRILREYDRRRLSGDEGGAGE